VLILWYFLKGWFLGKSTYCGSQDHAMAIEWHLRSVYTRTKYRIAATYLLTGRHTNGIRTGNTDTPDLSRAMTRAWVAPAYADRRRRQLFHD
jgi:hypothetical protein